ncbi:MAG: hypothetical protein A3F70_02875 [Acidobacteria bacterium RIFCSPLOWO2_12_FULL_67_14]|nr:MAG: hypothetical protein A3F70_02875 [Acidobacteria bacterium RIFCSPLOWO2_12_FULL_67_14]
MALSPHRYDDFAPEVRLGQAGAFGNALIDRVYAKLSPVYDVLFGAPLQPGRVAAVGRMGPAARTPCARGWHRHRHRDHAVAPYVISVVPDPVQVAREMRRVCRDRRVRRSMRASLRRDPPHSDSTWGGCHGERLTSSRGPA